MNKTLLSVCAVLALCAGAAYWLTRSKPKSQQAPLPQPAPVEVAPVKQAELATGALPPEPVADAPKSALPPVVTIKPGLYPGEEEVMIVDPETGQFIQHGYRTFVGPDGVKKRIAFERAGRPKTAKRMNSPGYKKFGQDEGAEAEAETPEAPEAPKSNAPFEYKLF